MKRILFVANAGSVHTARWVDYFVERGYDVHLATFGQANVTRCTQVHVLSLREPNRGGGNYRYLLATGRLAALLAAIRPDAVNAHYSYSFGLVAALALVRSGIRTAFSVVCHGSDVLAPPNRLLFDRVNRFVLSRADRCFAVSDEIGDALADRLKIAPPKIVVGQYGLELSRDSTTEKREVDVVSIRAWHPNSRIEMLLEGVAKTGDISAVFVLPGISEERLASLQRQYARIEFHAHLPHEAIRRLLRKSRVYVSATRSDGTSLSLLEAMDAGCIPVVSNIVANRSWILDGINGYLFSHGDAFVRKLRTALSADADAVESMRGISRRILSDKADYRTQMRKIESQLFDKDDR